MSGMDRAEALAHLAALGVTNDLSAVEEKTPALEATGVEVYAGGDVARVLVKAVHLAYRDDTIRDLVRPEAGIGDTVLLSEGEAKRLDDLGATVTKKAAKKASEPTVVDVPAVPTGDPSAAQPSGTAPEGTAAAVSDEQLAAMSAAELVAHVNQHNGDKGRVRVLETQRPQPRATVMKATAPEGDDPDEDLD